MSLTVLGNMLLAFVMDVEIHRNQVKLMAGALQSKFGLGSFFGQFLVNPLILAASYSTETVRARGEGVSLKSSASRDVNDKYWRGEAPLIPLALYVADWLLSCPGQGLC